jgi:hypothetical protein
MSLDLRRNSERHLHAVDTKVVMNDETQLRALLTIDEAR